VEATRWSSVLVVASYCDTAVDRVHPLATLLDALAGVDDVTAVRLQGLGPDVVAAMVPDADLAEALAAHGEGNPLYLGELLREMRHTGRLGEDGTVDGDVPFDADLLPRSTEDLLHRRISRLRPATRRLLAVASVVGRPFDLELVAATEEVRTERLRASAADGVAAGLLEPAGAGDGRYRFPHSVTRRAAYRRLAPNTRVRLHRRVGEALERSSTEGDDACRLAEMAAHFCAASPVGRSDVAARYAAAAGDAAMAVLAYETAADLYGRALALLDCSAPSSWSARCHLLLSLAEAQRQALEPVRARQALLEAATAAEAHDDARLLARVRDALETVGPVAGDAAAAALPRAATSGRSA
jgi:predicted ATPase